MSEAPTKRPARESAAEFLRRHELLTLQALASALLERAEEAIESHDLRAKVRRRPLLSAGLAACAGLIAGTGLRRLVAVTRGARAVPGAVAGVRARASTAAIARRVVLLLMHFRASAPGAPVKLPDDERDRRRSDA